MAAKPQAVRVASGADVGAAKWECGYQQQSLGCVIKRPLRLDTREIARQPFKTVSALRNSQLKYELRMALFVGDCSRLDGLPDDCGVSAVHLVEVTQRQFGLASRE